MKSENYLHITQNQKTSKFNSFYNCPKTPLSHPKVQKSLICLKSSHFKCIKNGKKLVAINDNQNKLGLDARTMVQRLFECTGLQ